MGKSWCLTRSIKIKRLDAILNLNNNKKKVNSCFHFMIGSIEQLKLNGIIDYIREEEREREREDAPWLRRK